MNRSVTLRQIEVFVHVARGGNLTAAAVRLGLSQSAASMSLGELERLLGGPLFHRVGRGLRLNDRGRSLLSSAEAVLLAFRDFSDRAGGADGLSGDLVVACSTTIASYLFPSCMKAFLEMHQGLSLSLDVGNTEEIVEEVLKGEADLGLIEGDCVDQGLVTEKWLRDELLLCASPRHPLVAVRSVSLSRLAGETWILREEGAGTLSTLLKAFAEEDFFPDRVLRIGHTEAIKRAVESGLGISCLSRFALSRELRSGDLALIDTPFRPHRWFCLIRRRGPRSAALGLLVEWLLERRSLLT